MRYNKPHSFQHLTRCVIPFCKTLSPLQVKSKCSRTTQMKKILDSDWEGVKSILRFFEEAICVHLDKTLNNKILYLFKKKKLRNSKEKNTLLYMFICLLFLALFLPFCIFIFPWFYFLSPWRTFLAFLLVWIFYCRVLLAFVYLKMSLFHFHFFSVFFWNNHRFTRSSKKYIQGSPLNPPPKFTFSF